MITFEPLLGIEELSKELGVNKYTLYKKIREDNEHVLLLDAGDTFQGTPYFNMYGGGIHDKKDVLAKIGMQVANLQILSIGNEDFHPYRSASFFLPTIEFH